MEYRSYQREAISAVIKEWNNGNRKTLLVLPTGMGKTVCFAGIAKQCVLNNLKVLVIAHREELIQQARAKISDITGIDAGIERASDSAAGGNYPIIVGSMQTLQRIGRLGKYPRNFFGAVIVDEAHHVMSSGYQKILSYFENPYVLGVTATPYRGDKKALTKYFDSVAYECTLIDGIKDGYLSNIIVKQVPIGIDITNVSTRKGDYEAGQVGRAIEPYLERIADSMVDCCKGRNHIVVFTPLIAISQKFCEILNRKGFSACEINASTNNRSDILSDFKNGRYNVLCNAMILTEGWDCPPVDCVINLRPTKLVGLYMQMIGRGTRPSPETGKENLLVLDFLWQTDGVDLCRPASLVAKDIEHKKRMNKILGNGMEEDLSELSERAERDILAEREESMRKKLALNAKNSSRTFSVMEFISLIGDYGLSNYSPLFRWEREPASQKQIQVLNNYGFKTIDGLTKGLASALISKLIERAKERKCTSKQLRTLIGFGFANASEWTIKQASTMIKEIADNNWQIPSEVNPLTYKPD